MSHASVSVPDACSLERPAFEERLAWIRAISRRARRRRPIPGGLAWEFDATDPLREELARLVERERACCDPERIAFSLHEDPASATLRLEVLGIDSGDPLLGGRAPASGWRRLAGAGGIGAAGAFALLCGVPMLVAAVAGAAVAAPFAVLETPAALGAGTLALGGLAWWILRRRANHTC